MTVIKRTAMVAYLPSEMYELVNDVEKYPEFLPWCRAVTLISRTVDEVRATLHILKGGIHHSFSTLNRLQHNKVIELRLLEGPFQHLEGCWRFDSEEGGCRISLDMKFALANKLLNFAVGPVIQNIANTFVESFCSRAETVYGKKENREEG
jgi:ribosome-associated toxin RatA of RatAB toxin-antitoxin module